MTHFKKIIPAVALVVALSPFAASASQDAAHQTGYLNGTVISQVAANSKGRPAEFNTNTNQVAANSKGRPAEFNTNTNQVAANSKGRPAEFNTATNNQVAENSKGPPAEFAPPAPETPIG
jgi:Skp family chaperone for outer membrane proteins